jgi:cyclase
MANLRLIARLDIKGPYLIKGVQLEGLRRVGDPQAFATEYYEQGIDELLYMDAVASLYQRNSLHEIVTYTAEHIFVPLTVGGGVRSEDDARTLLAAGADKIAVNTAAIKEPALITRLAERFGSQCVVLSIEAKRTADGRWLAYVDNGREPTHLDAVAWAAEGQARGAGEILVTSVDRDGTRKGFDVALTKAVAAAVSIPVIASGGMGSFEHLVEVVGDGGVEAVAMADALHFRRLSVPEIRRCAVDFGLPVRRL